ncbi:unnamed protein product [Nippostrongylus brasiliensis]|uniref:Chitinase domain-containing protein 1 n=1 Tax=Nippostrongylus brasiliensis TaxID=27835 RepID=A0A0N4XV79_NIPBR|nr:unnamed protein product [Nippostrongylus brasiliensis]
MLWLRISVLLVLITLSSQKGKSDRKVKKVEDEKTSEEAAKEVQLPLLHPHSSVTKESILKNHEIVDFSERKFENPVLVYVTPWNNKGYDLAKWISHKVTHVSPVWLQIKPQTADMSYSCRIQGIHDIDHDWMNEVRKNNSNVAIVPRVLFEEWGAELIVEFFTNERWMHRCLGDLMNLLTRSQFDGAVIEVWMNAMIQSRGRASELMVEMLRSWSSSFHERNLQLIVPVGPPLTPSNKLSGMFLPAHLYALAEKVDYVQIMTYDYRTDDPTGVAPYDWVKQSIEVLVGKSPDLAKQLLVGLNYYGYHFTSNEPQAINYDTYLEKVKKSNSKLEWDSEVKEHVLKIGKSQIYYPSLTSIEMRLNLARKYEVGVGIWDFGQGLNYFTQLL